MTLTLTLTLPLTDPDPTPQQERRAQPELRVGCLQALRPPSHAALRTYR